MSAPDTAAACLPEVLAGCRRVLDYAHARNYSGYGKFDALNSPVLKWLSMNRPLLRLAIIQGVMRCPFHIRPWLGIAQSPNPKGVALFASAYLSLYEAFGQASDLERAHGCLRWLLENGTPGYHGLCWGYNFDWQNAALFYAPRGFPNCVVTTFCGEALLHGARVTGREEYLDAAGRAARFILNELPVLLDTPDHKCIAYVPIEGVGRVINVNALAGAFLAKLAAATQARWMREEAVRMVRYVVSTQTDYGAWYYTDPARKSYIQHDHYHTGFILDGILETGRAAGTDAFDAAYARGLDFYIRNLFLDDGAPKYMSNRVYPHDIHGAAQALITLTKAGRTDLACRTARWTLRAMQHPDGWFYYQIGRWVTRRFTLMRWCNAWMARGLAELAAGLGRDGGREKAGNG